MSDSGWGIVWQDEEGFEIGWYRTEDGNSRRQFLTKEGAEQLAISLTEANPGYLYDAHPLSAQFRVVLP